MAEHDIDRTLRKEEKELIKDKEIKRIIRCFRLDYYTVLGIQPGITKEDIAKIYKKKSLLIHPDKTRNPRAVDAFDLLRKAATALADDKKRAELDNTWADARSELIQEKGWTVNDDRLVGSEFLSEWRAKVKEILIDSEFVKRLALKREQAKQARERREEDELKEEKKRAKRKEASWESHRDDRVQNWRKFSKKLKHKKQKESRAKVLI